MKNHLLFGILAVTGCAPDRLVQTASTPKILHERRALSDSEYVAACEHRRGARMRLYGCVPRGPQRIPLIIVDGTLLPTDTIGPGRVRREQVLAALDPNQIESMAIMKTADSTALSVHGEAARFGIINISLRPAFRKTLRGTEPVAR
ncbi:MAG: hypothetical protein WKF55_01665 [Gemmatimonadaceae bacterium]